jgi:hypothetical protein
MKSLFLLYLFSKYDSFQTAALSKVAFTLALAFVWLEV